MITKYDGDLRKHLVSNCAYSQHHSGAQPTHLELKENKSTALVKAGNHQGSDSGSE